MLRRMSARGSFLSLFDLLRNLSPCGRVGQSPIKGARLDYSTIAVSYRQLPLTRHRVGIVILRYPRPASRHGFTPLAGQFRYSRIKTVVVDRLVLIQGEADVRRIFGVRVTVFQVIKNCLVLSTKTRSGCHRCKARGYWRSWPMPPGRIIHAACRPPARWAKLPNRPPQTPALG